MTSETLTAAAAAYAAIVATGALALEIRRWFESGPRLSLRLMVDAKLYGGPTDDPNNYLCAIVTNRGTSATTVTHLALLEYRTIYHRWRGRNCKAGYVSNPAGAIGQPVPHLLQPGTEWIGAANYDAELRQWAASGKLFVAIYHSHNERPVVEKVKLSLRPPVPERTEAP